MRIQFKGKPLEVSYIGTDTPHSRRIRVPELTRNHCDMNAFRQSRKYGGYANSDLFPAMLRRIRDSLFPRGYVELMGELPAGVTVDSSGFLTVVTVDVPDA